MKQQKKYRYKDYYPGGMLMPGRSFNTNSYRFGGAGGQEKDDEISEEANTYTAKCWMYDSRLNRRWNVDPIPVAWESGYAAFRNNPVLNIDPDGAWVKGAGFVRNVFDSDAKILAQDSANETDGVAFKQKGSWTATYMTGETVDFGDGNVELKTVNVEHFSNKAVRTSLIKQIIKNPNRLIPVAVSVSGEIDTPAGEGAPIEGNFLFRNSENKLDVFGSTRGGLGGGTDVSAFGEFTLSWYTGDVKFLSRKSFNGKYTGVEIGYSLVFDGGLGIKVSNEDEIGNKIIQISDFYGGGVSLGTLIGVPIDFQITRGETAVHKLNK